MPSHPKTFSLALVTGASSGIGEALCRLLASKKIPLLITARDPVRLTLLANELQSLTSVETYMADLSLPEDRQRLTRKIRERGPDLIINNAGFGLYGDALTYNTDEQLNILNVNGAAVLELTLEGARNMQLQGKPGVILNLSSAAAFEVFPAFAVYSATKAFVNQVSQALDFEMRPHGIRVLTSCPGMVSTPFSKKASGNLFDKKTSGSMTPTYAAQQVWNQIEKGKRIKIFDWKVRFQVLLSRLLPKELVSWILSSIIKKRLSK